jgi:hypothetical protein
MSWRTLISPCICWRKPWPRRGPHRPVPDVITASRRASARTSTVTGAPVRLLDPSPQTTSRPLLSPTCSPGSQLPPGHRHWLARALSPSSRTTTVRQYRASASPRVTRSVLPCPRHDALQHRHNVSYRTPPFLAPSSPWTDELVDDLPAPSAKPRPYKYRLPRDEFRTTIASSPSPRSSQPVLHLN